MMHPPGHLGQQLNVDAHMAGHATSEMALADRCHHWTMKSQAARFRDIREIDPSYVTYKDDRSQRVRSQSPCLARRAHRRSERDPSCCATECQPAGALRSACTPSPSV